MNPSLATHVFPNSLSSSLLSRRRWELFHGHNSEGAEWEAHSTNPREPDALSFEYVRYGMKALDKSSASKLAAASKAIADLEDALQSELLEQRMPAPGVVSKPASPVDDGSSKPMDVDESSAPTTLGTENDDAKPLPSTDPSSIVSKARLDVSEETVEQLCLAAYLLSPASSGLYDELLALVHMGVLEISSSTGIPLVAEDWASKIDFVVLEDMDGAWGTEADPDGRFCIHPDMRDALEEEWVKTSNGGWALASDPEDVIFDPDVLEEWRQFFQGQLEEKANISEGIGRFGL